MSSGAKSVIFSPRVVENLLTAADFLPFFAGNRLLLPGGQIKCPLFHRGIAADVR
jgi:hypothetical protein